MTDPRPCPRRHCNGTLKVIEQGNLNGIDVTYSLCDNPDCGYAYREQSNPHAGDQPTLEA